MTGGHLSGGSPDPTRDILLYRPPSAAADLGSPDSDIRLYFFSRPGYRVTYYLCTVNGHDGDTSIWLLESRLDAAAFILGSEDWDLARLDEPGRERIRSHFPEYFQ